MVIGLPKLLKDITETLSKAIERAANDPQYVKYVLERNASHTYLSPDKVSWFS